MPVGDQHHGGIAMAIAIGPGGFEQAVDLGICQVLARPHLGIAYALRWPMSRIYCPNNDGWCDQRQVWFCH
jgi:hypothetical protein